MYKNNDFARRPSLLEKKLRSCVLTGAVLGIMDYVLFLTDFAVSGRLLGESALSGLTVINPFITFLTFVNILIPAGTAASIAFFQGKGDIKRCNRLFGQGILVTAFLGILFSLIVFAVSLVNLPEHINISADAAYHAKQYLSGLIFMPLFMFFNTFLYYILIGEGFEMTCIFSSAAKLLVNITLDIILCPVFGTFGIGIATMLGYLASLLVKLIPVIQKKLSLRFMRSFSAKGVLRLAADSLSLSADFIWPVLFSAIMNLSLLACFGDRILVIFSVILNAENLFLSIFSCMANSVQAGICQYFSEENYVKIHRIITYMLCGIGIISCVLSILFVVFAGNVPGFFGIHDSSLNDEAVSAIRMYVPFAIFLGLSTMLSRYYVCIRHKAYGVFISCISLVVLPFILQLILGLAIGSKGVWIGLGAGYLASFVLNFLFVSRIRRRQEKNCHLLFLYDLEAKSRQISYDIISETTEIMNCVYDLENRLKGIEGLSSSRRSKIVLMAEENCINIADQNPGKTADIEISVICPEKADEPFSLIIRNNGRLTDMTDGSGRLNSFREYVISSVMITSEENYYMSKKTDKVVSCKF